MRGDSGRYGLWPMGYGYGLWAWVDMQNGAWAQSTIQNTRGADGCATGYGLRGVVGVGRACNCGGLVGWRNWLQGNGLRLAGGRAGAGWFT